VTTKNQGVSGRSRAIFVIRNYLTYQTKPLVVAVSYCRNICVIFCCQGQCFWSNCKIIWFLTKTIVERCKKMSTKVTKFTYNFIISPFLIYFLFKTTTVIYRNYCRSLNYTVVLFLA